MNLRRVIDATLWPYLRRRWVYVASLVAFFLLIGSSMFLRAWQATLCDPVATVIMIVVVDSRDRYVMWRDAHVRRRTR